MDIMGYSGIVIWDLPFGIPYMGIDTQFSSGPDPQVVLFMAFGAFQMHVTTKQDAEI